VMLDGSGSWDAENDPLTYEWAFVAIPPGSGAALSDSGVQQPTFVADLQGVYMLSLRVSDPWVPSELLDTVEISFNNVRPIAVAGVDQSVAVRTTVALDGRASSDANGDPLTYALSFATVPPGSGAQISDANRDQASFFADQSGLYTLLLKVHDGRLESEPSTLSVTALTQKGEALDNILWVFDLVNDDFPDDFFKNKSMKKPFTQKLNVILMNIDQGALQEALDKLRDDIMVKVDGCDGKNVGVPDKNDWLNCESQSLIHPYLQRAMKVLEELL
jgi:hypothetical protein